MTLSARGALLLSGALLLACSAPRAAAPDAPRPERVNDWLEHLPQCAMTRSRETTRRSRATHLVYPRPGLPAVVRPGGRLVTRVQVPTPLTPPPGIQQEKALRGWHVQLLGHAHVIGDAEHRYELRVADVRPDDADSLVYRASVDLPAWVAPGTYDVVVEAPWSSTDASVASLRVLAPGEGPRFAALPSRGPEHAADHTLAGEAVDVFVGRASEFDAVTRRALVEPLRGEGVPWLDLDHPGVVFRVGDAVAALGGCDDPFFAWAEVVARQDAEERDLADARPLGSHEPARWSRRGDAHVLAAGGARVVGVALPEGQTLEVAGGTVLGWWPSVPARPAGHRPSVLARVAIDDGAELVLRARPAPTDTLEVRGPRSITSELHGRFEATRADGAPSAYSAWSWEEDGAAYVDGAVADVGFRWLGPTELHVMSIAEDGRVARGATSLRVETTLRQGSCAAGGGAGGGGVWFVLVCAWLSRSARARLR